MSDELVLRILIDPAKADPYPLLHELRETAPVYKGSLHDTWFVSSFEACEAVLHDQCMGLNQSGDVLSPNLMTPPFGEERRPLLAVNPPEHTRLRALVGMALTPESCEQVRPAVEAMVAEELDDLVIRGGVCDVVHALAFPLSADAISELVGIPAADHKRVRPMVSKLSPLLDPAASPDDRQQAEIASDQFSEYLADLIARRRAEPADDVLSALLAARDGEDRLSHNEVVSAVLLMYGAGFETTMNLIGNMVHTLVRHPDQLGRVRADRSLVPSAVEEVIRFESPLRVHGRFVRADTEVGGETLPAGHALVALIGAANRDPAVVNDPDRFDVGRDEVPHLTFSAGIHACMGTELVRLLCGVLLDALLDRFPTWTLLDDSPPWQGHIQYRGLDSLPLRLR